MTDRLDELKVEAIPLARLYRMSNSIKHPGERPVPIEKVKSGDKLIDDLADRLDISGEELAIIFQRLGETGDVGGLHYLKELVFLAKIGFASFQLGEASAKLDRANQIMIERYEQEKARYEAHMASMEDPELTKIGPFIDKIISLLDDFDENNPNKIHYAALHLARRSGEFLPFSLEEKTWSNMASWYKSVDLKSYLMKASRTKLPSVLGIASNMQRMIDDPYGWEWKLNR